MIILPSPLPNRLVAVTFWGGGACHSWRMNKKQGVKEMGNCHDVLWFVFELHLHNNDLLFLLTYYQHTSRGLDLRGSIACG